MISPLQQLMGQFYHDLQSKADRNVIGSNSPMVDKLNFYLNESVFKNLEGDIINDKNKRNLADKKRQKRQAEYNQYLQPAE